MFLLRVSSHSSTSDSQYNGLRPIKTYGGPVLATRQFDSVLSDTCSHSETWQALRNSVANWEDEGFAIMRSSLYFVAGYQTVA